MITLAITTYQRTGLLYESFAQVLDDPRISEIVIIDDCSDDLTRITLQKYQEILNKGHVKLFFNEKNLGCYHNKRRAVELASNEWVILFDSDNIITKEYVDKIENRRGNETTISQPCFAKPHFNFCNYEGMTITKYNAHEFANESTFTTALNAMNYFVNRDEFLRVFEDRPEPWTADSILINYNWLNAGNSIYFCPGLEYYHRVNNHGNEEQSHYKTNIKRTQVGFHDEIIRKLREMR